MKSIRILHIEDSEEDAALVARILQKSNIPFLQQVVNTEKEFTTSLDKWMPDIVLSDHSMPKFDSISALKIVQDKGIVVPFILVTGTTSEDFAVSVIKAGADDYILKDRLQRLPSAVLGLLEKYSINKDRIQIEIEKKVAEKQAALAIKALVFRLQLATSSSGIGIWDWNIITDELDWDEAMFRLYNTDAAGFGNNTKAWLSFLHTDYITIASEDIRQVISVENKLNELNSEYKIVWKDGSIHYIKSKGIVERNEKGDATRMIGVNWDITEQKKEEQHLKLLESVITHTNDAIMITDAESINEQGHQIVYVNDAFTRMTGYTAGEVIGKSPKILQGTKSDKKELAELSKSIKKWQSSEITTINYKKNGEEFWINFSTSPVANEKGFFTHWIAIQKDVTQQKQEQLEKAMIAEISQLFNTPFKLKEILLKVLTRLVKYAGVHLGEIWLVDDARKRIKLFCSFTSCDAAKAFYQQDGYVESFGSGEGLPGIAWVSKTFQFWQNLQDHEQFIRKVAAKKAGIATMYSIPIIYNDEVIGILVFGNNKNEQLAAHLTGLLEHMCIHIGAEIKRKQVENELNQIFSFAPDIICIAGLDGYFKKINPAACELLEYSEAELLAQPFNEFVHPDDKDKTYDQLIIFAKTMPTSYFENRYLTKSGKIKWLAWTTTTSPEEHLIFAVAKDITEKKELENLLDKANRLAKMGSWEIDLEKDTFYCSKITKEITEMDEDYTPTLEKAIQFYKKGKTRDTILLKIKDAIEKNISIDIELPIITQTGTEKWVRCIGEPEFMNNKCTRLYGSLQDIDDRKKTEINLKKSLKALEDYQFALHQSAIIAVTDLNDMITKVNDNFCTISQYKREELVGKNSSILNSDFHPSTFFTELWNTITTGKVWRGEIRNKAKYGEIFWLDTTIVPFLDENQQPVKYLAIQFDITHRKTAEIRLIELNEDLQNKAKALAESNADLEQFAYVASHDLQEPLRMISSFLTLLEKKYANIIDENGKKYIDFAVDGSKRMRQIILDLLEFSRVGKKEDSQAAIDLNEIINEIRLLFGKQISDKSATITAENLPVIFTHRTTIRQVLQNLVSNALKYCREGVPVQIEISVSETTEEWQFAIKDNGIGIKEEFFNKIFIIFQRLHTREEYAGTGLGLAITKKIIESKGGKIWLQSEENCGSTFYFTLKKMPALQ